EGVYTIPSLHIGAYDLRVTMNGFKTVEAKALRVVAGETVSMDITLVLGVVSEITTVTAMTPLVDATTNALGTTRTLKEITDLPLAMAGQGRNFLGWLLTIPGVNYVPDGSWATFGGLSRANINGVGRTGYYTTEYGYVLDGVSAVSFAN